MFFDIVYIVVTFILSHIALAEIMKWQASIASTGIKTEIELMRGKHSYILFKQFGAFDVLRAIRLVISLLTHLIGEYLQNGPSVTA